MNPGKRDASVVLPLDCDEPLAPEWVGHVLLLDARIDSARRDARGPHVADILALVTKTLHRMAKFMQKCLFRSSESHGVHRYGTKAVVARQPSNRRRKQ